MQTQLEPKWPDRPALFLDLDGTLVEFAQRPDAVEPSEQFQAIVARLAKLDHGAVAFVSGRQISELDRLLAPHRFAVAGVHGSERRDSHGRQTRSVADAGRLRAVHELLAEFAIDNPGVLIEDKTISTAVHYRQAPEVATAIVGLETKLAAALPDGYELLRGNMVLEIKPGGADKGTAIRDFMSEPPFAGRTPVFIGDDVTDEAGFAVVNELGGVTIKVNSGKSAAKWRLPGVAAVLAWLDRAIPE